jgi:hypothetical protein
MLAKTTILNALSSAKRLVTALLRRKPVFLPDADRDRRLLVCEECPFFDPGPGRCDSCGCYVELKAPLRTEKCPENRWPI